MKRHYLFKLLLISLVLVASVSANSPVGELNLMPVPAKIVGSEGKFRLDEKFTIAILGQPDPRVYPEATRALRRLAGRTGLFFPQDFITAKSQDPAAQLTIECQRPAKIILHEDESYRLVIQPEKLRLTAPTDLGALRGLETLLQLLTADENGYYFPVITIDDQPRFPWRGLMIDAGRHFMPVEMVKRNLDGMAAVKLNVMHWHLSEDQGFRVESKTYPKLHEMGSDGFYYTQAQIKEVIDYAAARGIRVVPEFDMPGHATSWLVGYPELASAPGPYTIERKWGIMDPTMDPTKETTYTFLDNFFKEMTALFPDDYMHIGGDENNGKHWDANPDIQKFMKANNIPDNHLLQSYFNKRVLAILTQYGKKMIGWDEIFQPDLPTDVVIHSWRGPKALAEAAQQGYQAILSNGYYIDLMQPTDFHYLNDPIPEGSPLTEAEKKRILGGEATMWSEFVNAETVDSRIWPRTAAIAERFWSPGAVKDVADMYRRLETVSFRLEELDLLHEKNYEMMLRRLTHNTDINALKVLVDVIEPVKIYTRGAQRAYTSFSPLSRVVDAARADAKTAREFRNLVDAYLNGDLNDLNKVNRIVRHLTLWKANHAVLVKTIRQAPILTEIESLSQDLATCGLIGLETLAFLQNGQRAPEAWVKEKQSRLEQAKLPRGQTELMIVSAIEKMVLQASK